MTPRWASRDAAGRDAGKMRQVRLDVDRNAVERHPAPDADADGGDLVLGHLAAWSARLVRPRTQTPTRSSRRSPSTLKVGERGDEPGLESGDEGAHVRPAALEVEHDIGDALAGAVIGELAAAAGLEHGKARVHKVAALADVPAV